jgi:stage V sporulation protein R
MVVVSRDFQRIKQQMLYLLTNHCRPYIYVLDGNYGNRGELYLGHQHNGLDLEIRYVTETLRALHNIWSRPVHMQARIDDDVILFSFDGEQSHQRRLGDKDIPAPAHKL